eukprot:m.76117 g.76117  ORF g.76117 m.76117 type:complete len:53 (+) comp50437_c0_seq4:157-315(+)
MSPVGTQQSASLTLSVEPFLSSSTRAARASSKLTLQLLFRLILNDLTRSCRV